MAYIIVDIEGTYTRELPTFTKEQRKHKQAVKVARRQQQRKELEALGIDPKTVLGKGF